ncbi:MAG: GNAT family N-acetyltransferase [Verrucomicrobiaceae bacterium]
MNGPSDSPNNGRGNIVALNIGDLDRMKRLYKGFKKDLGFFPDGAFRQYLSGGECLGVIDSEKKLRGYLIFNEGTDGVRIIQICVCPSTHGKGYAKRLVDKLKSKFSSKLYLRLKCRRDFDAHRFWTHMGFVVHNEEVGKSKEGHILSNFYFRFSKAPNQDLLSLIDSMADDRLAAVIDAQIFFDIFEDPSPKNLASQNLTSGFSEERCRLFISDETLAEIDRKDDRVLRKESRDRARGFDSIPFDHARADLLTTELKSILPHKTPNQISDIRQIAKAAASSADCFLTRDELLSSRSNEILELTGLEVLRPTEFLLELHEKSRHRPHSPRFIAGMSLKWERLSSTFLKALDVGLFTLAGERSTQLRNFLEDSCVDTTQQVCEILRASDLTVGIRVLRKSGDSELELSFIRLSRESTNPDIFQRFLLADTIKSASEQGREIIKLTDTRSEALFGSALDHLGFARVGLFFVRLIIPEVTDRSRAARITQKLGFQDLSSFSDEQMERLCAPMQISPRRLFFMIPIIPNFARQMLDDRAAQQDMFAEKAQVFLRTENVFYRTHSRHHMLNAPARILWYVSGEVGELIAVSDLDQVVSGEAKQLFKTFKKFGVLDWREVLEVCQASAHQKIMALKFSNTHPFEKPLPLKLLRQIFSDQGHSLVLQSPCQVSREVAQKLFKVAFPSHAEKFQS